MSETDVPWLSEDEQAAWRSYLHGSQLLSEELDRQLLTEANMTHTYYGILVALSEAPGRRLRMSDLAALNRHSQSRLSHAMIRLEEAGWVRRERCREDRRQNFASLTEAGQVALAAAAPGHVRRVRAALFDALTPEQVGQLRTIFDAVLDRLGAPPCPGSA